MNKLIPLLAALALVSPAHAEPVSPPAAQSETLSEGVVRRIDAANGKITLRHGPLLNLDMPPMTMVFRVRPPELLNAVKVGDKVRFRAEDDNGDLVVTKIQVMQ
jgi:Cu/Ag efflux protein CusF